MKNLFLTFLLMFTVSFAFANEGDETMKPSEASPTVKVVRYQIITSCGTQIDMHADECNDTEMLDNAMYYECQHCGGC